MLQNVVAGVGSAIGYGSPLTLTDTSNKIKRGTKGDATALRPTVMAAVPAILDRVREGVRKKVREFSQVLLSLSLACSRTHARTHCMLVFELHCFLKHI